MPYKSETDAQLIVGRKYRTMLAKLKEKQHRGSLRAMNEFLIQEAYTKEFPEGGGVEQ